METLKRKRTRENIGLKMHFHYGVRLLSPWGRFPGLPSHSCICTCTCTHLPALCASTALCACVLFCYSMSSWVPLLGWAEDGAGLLAVMKTLCRNSDGLWEASPREPGGREWCQGGCTLLCTEVLQQSPLLGVCSPLRREVLHRFCAARETQIPARSDLVHQGLLLPLL